MGYIEELRAVVGHRPLILVGAVVIIIDELDRVLLQQRLHPYGKWAFPGGLMQLGESSEDTARREVFEETGLEIGQLQLLDVFSGPQNFIIAPNGDEFYTVTVTYITREVYGELRTDPSESLDFKFFHCSDIPNEMVRSHSIMLDRFLTFSTGLPGKIF